MSASPLVQRKRRARAMLGMSSAAVVFWIWLMWHAYGQGKQGWSVFGLTPFMFIAMFNAYNAWRRLKRVEEEAKKNRDKTLAA